MKEHLYLLTAFIAVLFVKWLVIHTVSRWVESRAIARETLKALERK